MLYSCLFCEHKTDSLVDFENHKRTVHGFKKGSFQCNKCSYVSRNIRCLKDHYDSVHDGIKYPCDECDKLYANTRALYRHKNAIHKQDPYFTNELELKIEDQKMDFDSFNSKEVNSDSGIIKYIIL